MTLHPSIALLLEFPDPWTLLHLPVTHDLFLFYLFLVLTLRLDLPLLLDRNVPGRLPLISPFKQNIRYVSHSVPFRRLSRLRGPQFRRQRTLRRFFAILTFSS